MQSKQQQSRRDRQLVAVGRVKQRVDLSKEFEEFKQRIQQFQNKNEEIISRIRDAYTVKKKNPQGEYRTAPVIHPSNPHLPQVYYQHNDAESEASSCDYSRDVVFEGNMARHASGRQARSIYQEGEPRVNQSAQQLPIQRHYQGTYEEYMRGQSVRLRTEEDRGPNSPDPTYSGRFGNAEVQEQSEHFEQQYRQVVQRNQQLEEILHENQQQLAKAQSQEAKMRNAITSLKHSFEDGLQGFQQEVIGERFIEIEKYIRRCELRLKNLGLRLRDSLQQRRARRIIGRSRSKRNSLSKPRNKQSSLSEEAQSTPKVSRAQSQSRGRRSDNPVKHHQFEQIAVDYENMIKAKAAEVEGLERRLNDEARARDSVTNQLIRTKTLLQQKQREIAELRKKRSSRFEEDGKQSKQLKELRQQLLKVQQQVKARQGREKQLSQTVARLQKAKKTMHEEYSQNLNKNKTLKQKAIQQLQSRLRQCESSAARQARQLRERLASAEKRLMEKECEMLTLANKLKKCENESSIKQQKLRELQGLLLKDNDHADLLDRSVSVDTSLLSHAQVRHLQDSLRKVEQQLEQRKALLYDLQKEKYVFQAWKREAEAQAASQLKANAVLQQKVSDLYRELQQYQEGRGFQRELQQRAQLAEELEGERQLLIEQKQELSIRNNELMEELKRAKQNNLTANRQLIKLNSELTFAKNQQQNLSTKLAKAKEEISILKSKMDEASVSHNQRETQLQLQIGNLREQVQNLRNQLLQAQTLANRNPLDKQQDILLNSLHVSDISFNYHPAKPAEDDPATLKQKLREAEAALQIKAGMEEQIQAQYKSNLDRLRAQATQRQFELVKAITQLEQVKNELQRTKGARREQQSFENLKVQVYQEKIVQMEEEYLALKQSEERLNQMLHQILETIKVRQQQKEKLLKDIEDKDRIIEEMKQIIELRQSAKYEPAKTNKSDTLRDFSLRVSGDHSEEIVDSAELSYLSNISDVFKRDDLLQDRIRRGRTGREQQAKLFARTAAYIKSLKAIIEGKQKRIKLLQKQLTALRAQEGRSWSDRQHSHSSRNYRTEQHVDEVEECDEFKDYDSVQLDTRRSKYTQLVKVLQNEKNLAVEENKLLNKQIEALQDQLLRSQQQENSLVRIKDLYKQEIKKLIEKNEIHTKQFETQIHKLKEQLQSSDSYHNLEAIKQLFIKIIPTAAFLDDPTAKPARREEKRKELEEYVKVMSSILQLQPIARDRLLACFKK